MNLSDQEILQLLAHGTAASGEGYSAELAEQLLEAAPTEALSPGQLASILAAAGIATTAPLAPAAAQSLLWKKLGLLAATASSVAGLFWLTHQPRPVPEGMERYDTAPPPPVFISSPLPIMEGPNLEPVPPSQSTFEAPPGLKNLALAAHITASLPLPSEELRKVADNAKGSDPSFDLLSLGRGPQSLTLDLGQQATLHTLVLWHRFDYLVSYRDVIVEASTTADFSHPIPLYNNDHDDTLGKGKGPDRAYVETNFGRVIPLHSHPARWLRVWSNGSQLSGENHYAEIQVWGLPAPP
jgi:hypothetical protein